MRKPVLFLILLLYSFKSQASCTAGFTEVIVQIVPDFYPYEVSWTINDLQGNLLASGDTSQSDTVCIPSTSCKMFTINDSFGDGILSPGGYSVYVDGILIASGNEFGRVAQHTFNCNPGTFCTGSLPLDTGNFTATFDNTWYNYTPGVTGTYIFSTCNLNTCNTQIWVYTNCPIFPYPEGVQGTFGYNNDNTTCGTQARISIVLNAGVDYFIRIGDYMDSCTGDIDFNFTYTGPVTGCMDISACNYNPLATIDDSSCIYFPDPACAGPDLELDSVSFVSSLYLTSHTASTCDVNEGCVTGFGNRYVIRFTSKIDNIGTQDFYIGNATTQPGMFNTTNCHGHAHYEGYGDYRLYDINGNAIPAGHKNGSCVIDLCGWGQYTCSNMGISAGCYDEYDSGTQCQWIDITDVPTGDYRLAVIINSKHLPDAMGRYETNYINNATQVCIHIEQHASGTPTFNILPNCTPYVDCLGIPGGNTELDCNGICNGTLVYGDVFPDAVLNHKDVENYMDLIQSSASAVTCNDLSGDNNLTIYDAALVNWCQGGNVTGTPHNHCNFPRNITNPNDLVSLTISNVDFTNNFLDVSVLANQANIKGYQFSMNGIEISSVVSLANPLDFPADVRYISSTNEIIGISLVDSSFKRGINFQQLVRIFFSAITDTTICIGTITDIINQDGVRTNTSVFGPCIPSQPTTISIITAPPGLVIVPNPVNERAYVHFPDDSFRSNNIKVYDVSGKFFEVKVSLVRPHWLEMDLKNLPQGTFILKFQNEKLYRVAKFVKL